MKKLLIIPVVLLLMSAGNPYKEKVIYQNADSTIYQLTGRDTIYKTVKYTICPNNQRCKVSTFSKTNPLKTLKNKT
jgi:hypothetical protein